MENVKPNLANIIIKEETLTEFREYLQSRTSSSFGRFAYINSSQATIGRDNPNFMKGIFQFLDNSKFEHESMRSGILIGAIIAYDLIKHELKIWNKK